MATGLVCVFSDLAERHSLQDNRLCWACTQAPTIRTCFGTGGRPALCTKRVKCKQLLPYTSWRTVVALLNAACHARVYSRVTLGFKPC